VYVLPVTVYIVLHQSRTAAAVDAERKKDIIRQKNSPRVLCDALSPVLLLKH